MGAARARSRRRGAAPGRGPSRHQLLIVAAAAALAVVALIWAGNVPASETLASTSGTDGARSTALVAGDLRGAASAPVTIDEWADFQCPACRSFALGAERELLGSYIPNGQVRVVFHNFAFLGAESEWAAEAAECARDQGRFFDYHDRLYAAQSGENRGTFTKANLERIAGELGLDQSFKSCLASDRYLQRVRDEHATGQAKGVRATPTLFVNGQKMEGAPSADQLRAVIDRLLAAR